MASPACGDAGRQARGRRFRKKTVTAHETYSIVVGEIGISREAFLFELKAWEINAIVRGYERRKHAQWESARFIAYCTVKSSMGGGKELHDIQDLIRFPWETDTQEPEISDDEINEIRQQLRQENEKVKDSEE